MKLFIGVIILFSILHAQNYIFNNKQISLEQIKENIYRDENNKEVRLKNNFFIKMQVGKNIKQLAKKYDIDIIKKYSKQLYLVKSTSQNILDLIQQINDDANTLYAYPNFNKKIETR
ncbi:MAG: hypothetical protein FAF05_02500 [Epsilonproteobacteria bacterium]|nr:hypothetical protein [Campylobacterota bacterium]